MFDLFDGILSSKQSKSSIRASGAASLASKIALKLTVSGRRHILRRWPSWNVLFSGLVEKGGYEGNTVNAAGILYCTPKKKTIRWQWTNNNLKMYLLLKKVIPIVTLVLSFIISLASTTCLRFVFCYGLVWPYNNALQKLLKAWHVGIKHSEEDIRRNGWNWSVPVHGASGTRILPNDASKVKSQHQTHCQFPWISHV